ncbi:MAG: formyl-CoA transferase [bacterium]|nr:formyl-CoA transferase [Deltaproteobacteria bacterium]MCP4904359.1 formyl-CoA transferase [bacterium]
MPALDGMRILDMTQYEAGTSCTQALAWMGADVVKVEAPGIGDPGRWTAGQGDYFWNWNLNKRSIAINLRSPEGRQVLLDLVPRFDVFVENYGPGVIERLDIGYETLKKVHPSIVYAQVKGFGLEGPYSNYLAYDMSAQAAAGTFSVTGEPDGPPTLPGVTIGDSGTGMQLGMAILAAYVQQLRTGEGQHIEISMQEAITYYMRTRLAHGGNWGKNPVPRNGSQIGAAPSGLYPCKPFGPNDYAFVLTVTARHVDKFYLAIDRPDLVNDERFAADEDRFKNSDALQEEIEQWTRQHTKHEVMKILGDAGIPCSATLDTVDLYEDPHLNQRGFIKTLPHPELGEVRLLGFAPRLSASDVEWTPPPGLGEHTDSVLAEELGFDTDRLKRLRAAEAIA